MKQCEICKKYFKSLDTHHIHSKSKGGSNKKYNLIEICPNCHREIHVGEIIIEGKFMSTDGLILIWHKKNTKQIINANSHTPDKSITVYNFMNKKIDISQ